MCSLNTFKGLINTRKNFRVLRVGHNVIGGTIFWAGLGFNGGGWLWRPVRVHTQFLGQVHVASLGSHLVWAT